MNCVSYPNNRWAIPAFLTNKDFFCYATKIQNRSRYGHCKKSKKTY